MSKSLKTITILFKAHQSIIESIKHSLKKEGINLNEFTVLEVLFAKGSMTTQEVCDHILIPNSSLTYVLDQLEKKEYIIRIKDKHDKRITHIQLSTEGRTFFSPIYTRHEKMMRENLNVLSSEEERTLQELLKRVGYHVEETL